MMHGLVRGSIPVLATLLLLPCLFFPPGTCTAAAPDDNQLRQRADIIAGVETNLLALFGFQRRPRPDRRRRSPVPPAMMHLYQEHLDNQLDTATLMLPGKHTATANTVRTYTHTVSSIDGMFPTTRDRFRLSFNVDNIPAGERLTAAELQLYSDAATTAHADADAATEHPSQPDLLYRVDVHDIIRPGIRGQSEPSLRLIDSRVVNVRFEDSVSFDVLPAVSRWLEVNQRNYGLLVEVSGLRGDNTHIPRHIRLRRDVHEDLSAWLPKQPLLFTYTDDGRNVVRKVDDIVRRSKRSKSFSEAKKHKRKEICRRLALYVDFADVGWNDWIVAPPGYEAYYCSGDCPFPLADHLNSTNHAIVQTLVNSVNPAAAPKACCVPTQLTSISMLYLDEENKVVLKNYQDMAVLGCGCR